MKRKNILGLCLIIIVIALATAGSNFAQTDHTFQAFWQKFKPAVIHGDKETVTRLSNFPMVMSYPAPGINNATEFRRRFRELFNEKVNAAQCFAEREPTRDTENPDRYTVGCPNQAGSDVAVYEFELTKKGWRLSHFQPTTTCRCRGGVVAK